MVSHKNNTNRNNEIDRRWVIATMLKGGLCTCRDNACKTLITRINEANKCMCISPSQSPYKYYHSCTVSLPVAKKTILKNSAQWPTMLMNSWKVLNQIATSSWLRYFEIGISTNSLKTSVSCLYLNIENINSVETIFGSNRQSCHCNHN